MENRQAFNVRFIKDNRELVLSRGFLDRKDRISLYLQEIHDEYGMERMERIAETGADPIAIEDVLTVDSEIAMRGNSYCVPILAEDIYKLGVKKGDEVEVTVRVKRRRRSPNNLTRLWGQVLSHIRIYRSIPHW